MRGSSLGTPAKTKHLSSAYVIDPYERGSLRPSGQLDEAGLRIARRVGRAAVVAGDDRQLAVDDLDVVALGAVLAALQERQRLLERRIVLRESRVVQRLERICRLERSGPLGRAVADAAVVSRPPSL
jgi:hypothetical protein